MYIRERRAENLGSLSSFFKKVVKTANKLNPLHSVAAKFDPVTKFVDKSAGIKAKPKLTAPAAPVAVPSTVSVAANTPDIPMSFAPSGGGGSSGGSSGGIPMPAPDASEAAAAPAPETDYTPWLLGAAAILGGILYFKSKRR